MRVIEKVLGKPIERWRLLGFNYGDFKPESQFYTNGAGQKGRPNGKKKYRYRSSRRYRAQAAN